MNIRGTSANDFDPIQTVQRILHSGFHSARLLDPTMQCYINVKFSVASTLVVDYVLVWDG